MQTKIANAAANFVNSTLKSLDSGEITTDDKSEIAHKFEQECMKYEDKTKRKGWLKSLATILSQKDDTRLVPLAQALYDDSRSDVRNILVAYSSKMAPHVVELTKRDYKKEAITGLSTIWPDDRCGIPEDLDIELEDIVPHAWIAYRTLCKLAQSEGELDILWSGENALLRQAFVRNDSQLNVRTIEEVKSILQKRHANKVERNTKPSRKRKVVEVASPESESRQAQRQRSVTSVDEADESRSDRSSISPQHGRKLATPLHDNPDDTMTDSSTAVALNSRLTLGRHSIVFQRTSSRQRRGRQLFQRTSVIPKRELRVELEDIAEGSDSEVATDFQSESSGDHDPDDGLMNLEANDEDHPLMTTDEMKNGPSQLSNTNLAVPSNGDIQSDTKEKFPMNEPLAAERSTLSALVKQKDDKMTLPSQVVSQTSDRFQSHHRIIALSNEGDAHHGSQSDRELIDAALKSLEDGVWINDTALDMCLKAIAGDTVQVLWCALSNPDYWRRPNCGVPKIDTSITQLVLPVNRRGHWSLALVDLELFRVRIFDSRQISDPKAVSEARSEIEFVIENLLKRCDRSVSTKMESHIEHSPPQIDHVNCGAYVFANCFAALHGEATFRQVTHITPSMWREIMRQLLRSAYKDAPGSQSNQQPSFTIPTVSYDDTISAANTNLIDAWRRLTSLKDEIHVIQQLSIKCQVDRTHSQSKLSEKVEAILIQKKMNEMTQQHTASLPSETRRSVQQFQENLSRDLERYQSKRAALHDSHNVMLNIAQGLLDKYNSVEKHFLQKIELTRHACVDILSAITTIERGEKCMNVQSTDEQ